MARLIDNGCFYTVQISESDLIEWAATWPCFGIRRAIWFQFERKSGDLVDMGNSEGMDDSGVLALSKDAQAWAKLRMSGKKILFEAELGVPK